MSILIPGKMPTRCWDCPCAYETEGVHHNYCQAVGYDTKLPDEGRPDWCPLIELPPHGDLIDRSKIRFTDFEIVMCDGNFRLGLKMLAEKIENALPVIPAEEG